MPCGSCSASSSAGAAPPARAGRWAWRSLKFTGQVLPESKLVEYRIDIKRVINRKLVLGVADGQVVVDGELIYDAKELNVGLFINPKAT